MPGATAPLANEAPATLRLPPPKLARVDRSRVFTVLNVDRRAIRVSDLDFAAYLLGHQLALIDACRVGDRESVFDFYDPDGRITELSMAYMNSAEARFADCVRRLKKASYSVPPDWDPYAARHRGTPSGL